MFSHMTKHTATIAPQTSAVQPLKLWSLAGRVSVPVLPLVSRVTLGKLLNHSVPWFLCEKEMAASASPGCCENPMS